MKKTLALLFVASLLLAGCTELTESTDEAGDEILKIDVNEEIAIEKIDDFITIDEGETFGITMMYDMDTSMMEGLIEDDEDSDAVITVEMTEAWSPDGYHSTMTTGLSENGTSIKMIQSVTHVGTTMYVDIGYETQGDICEEEESQEEIDMCEMMFGDLPDLQRYSMTTTKTHTDVITAMAEGTSENSEDMDPMAMLMFFSFVECYGVFTPAESVDGLQVFDVTMEGMDGEELTPEMAMCVADTDDSDSVSFEEFTNIDGTDEEEIATMQALFDDADTNTDDELTIDEIGAFIDAVDAHYESEDGDHGDHDHDHDDMDDEDESELMPGISVAFNDAGEIEYLEMEMDEMGDEPMTMKMYVLTDQKVNSYFTSLDAGEAVALPFTISDSMSGSSGEFMCNDGSTIPSDWVNDGMEDCDGGEDEMGMDDGDVEMIYKCDRFIQIGTFESSTDDFDTQYSDSFDSSLCGTTASEDAEANLDDSTSTMPTSFVVEECSSDGCYLTTIEIMGVADSDVQEVYGTFDEDTAEDCEGDYNSEDALCTEYYGEIVGTDDNTISIVQSRGVMFQCADGMTSVDLTYVNDGMSDCPDGSDESSYDENGDDTMTFTCLDGTTIPLDYVLDSDSDCDGGEDEMPYMEFNFWFDYQYDATTGSGLIVYVEEVYDDSGDEGGHDHGHNHGDDSDEIVMYVTSNMDFQFEGDMSDYKVELASCDYDYDMDTGEETSTCTTVMSVAIADAGGDSDIMFHDADSSETISVGDMIHIGETAEDWDTVRLYSISADAYSDENPMHDAPGFTGLVGMLALLGAAFIRRNE